MNESTHKEIARAAFICAQQHIPIDVLGIALNHLDVTMYWDGTFEDLKKVEPDWQSVQLINSGTGVLGNAILNSFDSPFDLLYESAQRTAAALQSNNIELAIKQLLAISHYFADLAQPVHAINTEVLDVLLPRPNQFRFINLHQLVESKAGVPDLANYEFTPVRADISDIIFFIDQKLKLLKQKCGHLLIPLTKAIYTGNEQNVLKYASAAATWAAKVFCDFVLLLFYNSPLMADQLPKYSRRKKLQLAKILPENCILDMCCNYKPMIDSTVVYDEPGRDQDIIKLNGKQCKGICVIPLSPRASNHPNHSAIPFEHGKCIALLEYVINPNNTYIFATAAGHNETTYNGGNIRVAFFTDKELLFKSDPITGTNTINVKLHVQAKRFYCYAEDIDQAYPPIKYVVFKNPTLQIVKHNANC